MRRRRGPDLGDADIRLMLQLALRANRVVAHGMPSGEGRAGLASAAGGISAHLTLCSVHMTGPSCFGDFCQ